MWRPTPSVPMRGSRTATFCSSETAYRPSPAEIYADDVKCSRGATVGAMDSGGDPPLYAAARPAGEAQARRCRSRGFVGDVVRRCGIEPLCEAAMEAVVAKLEKIITMFDVEKIREEFPILHREVYGKPLVYLDSGAGARTAGRDRDGRLPAARTQRQYTSQGAHLSEATTLYEAARERIGAFIGAAERKSSLRPALRLRSIRWPMPGVRSSSVRATISLSARWSTPPISCPGRCSPNARARKSASCPSTTRAPVHRTAAVAAG